MDALFLSMTVKAKRQEYDLSLVEEEDSVREEEESQAENVKTFLSVSKKIFKPVSKKLIKPVSRIVSSHAMAEPGIKLYPG